MKVMKKKKKKAKKKKNKANKKTMIVTTSILKMKLMKLKRTIAINLNHKKYDNYKAIV
jgi:hypothetical protein